MCYVLANLVHSLSASLLLFSWLVLYCSVRFQFGVFFCSRSLAISVCGRWRVWLLLFVVCAYSLFACFLSALLLLSSLYLRDDCLYVCDFVVIVLECVCVLFVWLAVCLFVCLLVCLLARSLARLLACLLARSLARLLACLV